MKKTLLLFGRAALTVLLLASFVSTENDNNAQKPKKSRHVRMVTIKDGKKMAIDTVFANDDVFVWNGDTINPGRPMGPGMIPRFGREDGDPNFFVFKHWKGERKEPPFVDMEPTDDMDVRIDENDSAENRMMIGQMGKEGPADRMPNLDGPGMQHFPPVPPAPPVPRIMKLKHPGKIIDLNDPNVVSYKKKDLKGGLEKIEIIRKKTDEKGAATFDFQFDGGDFMAPEPPEAPGVPGFDFDSPDDSLEMKIIEKKKIINGKNGNKTDVEVEPSENK